MQINETAVTTSTTPTTTTKIPEDSSVETVAANQVIRLCLNDLIALLPT